ncbi:MAG: hypothetical protein ACD_22C00068G0003 [uncultured bacterium]|nr:MAG: hypothetical protein ACD_22C00068G0003 [uncultured bacterium]
MAIQQHPIPQDISNYKFRLIGDMTIKQFASLGISIILAVIIYSSPIPFFFKYPFSFVFLALGVGMAFVPVQGRTLDVWIIAFIKSIYSPTQYIWKHGQEATSNISPAVSTTIPQTTIDPQMSVPNTPIVDILPPTAEKSPPDEIAPIPEQQTPPTPKLETIAEKIIDIPETELKNDSQSEIVPPIPNTSPIPASPSPEIQNLPIPFTPTTPNTLVGLTLTPDGHILDGVLVEIKNQGLTLRATKSNKLGQFLFARPLENGLYQILAEKEDYTFSEYSIELAGAIMNPLKIQALK